MPNTAPKIEMVSYNAFAKLVAVAVICAVSLSILAGVLVFALAGGFDRFEDQARYRSPQGNAPLAPSGASIAVAGHTVYAPAYSHIYVQEGSAYRLAVTLSIRNTDTNNPIFINSVIYYNSEGAMLRTYLDKRLELAPFAAAEFFVPETDTQGGSGASFLVKWDAPTSVNPPLIESVMIGTNGQQGISFVCTGVVADEKRPTDQPAETTAENSPQPAS